jgi:hypothetical protein
MNKEVSFDLAKLLKEKGFDINVFSCYNSSSLLRENYSIINQYENLYIEDKGECLLIPYDDNDGIYLEKINFNAWEGKYSAPTIAEVIMWIYQKYKTWIYATPYKEKDYHFTIIEDKEKRKNLTIYDESLYGGIGKEGISFSSIEEAYEKGIEYFLKNK